MSCSPRTHRLRAFDAAQPFRIERLRRQMLLPTHGSAPTRSTRSPERSAPGSSCSTRRCRSGTRTVARAALRVVLHGAEVTVPGRLPGSPPCSAGDLRRRALVAAGGIPSPRRRACRDRDADWSSSRPASTPSASIRSPMPSEPRPVGVSASPKTGRSSSRVSRLVPRKGMDVLIEAAAALGREDPELTVAIGGPGRDAAPRAAHRPLDAPVRLLGRVADAELPAALRRGRRLRDALSQPLAGLEQEGFGIVFLEAAAVRRGAGRRDERGSRRRGLDGETGLVVDRPATSSVRDRRIRRLLDDAELRAGSATGATTAPSRSSTTTAGASSRRGAARRIGG